jgi:hypothetical protein
MVAKLTPSAMVKAKLKPIVSLWLAWVIKLRLLAVGRMSSPKVE